VTPLTLDASVVVKWFHPVPSEPDLLQAEALRQAYAAQRVVLYQPPHWRAEVAGVLTRLAGRQARRDVEDLCLFVAETVEDTSVYLKATELAARLSRHVFDTLYHAVALAVPGCRLVTADDRYLLAARPVGRLVRLRDWRPG
jgi:predicted nucleic acid-binding protein